MDKFYFTSCLVLVVVMQIFHTVNGQEHEREERILCPHRDRSKRQLGIPCRSMDCCDPQESCGGCSVQNPRNQRPCYRTVKSVCGSSCQIRLGQCTSVTKYCYKREAYCCKGFNLIGNRCICDDK